MARVLVVDDEADIRGLVRLSLELDGHEVQEAVDGLDALLALDAGVPDLVILDVAMPRLDGWGVLARLKGSAALATVPVVMLTALRGDMDRIRGGVEGAVRYVTKPFDPDELRAEVRDVLTQPEPAQRRRAAQEAMARLAVLEKGDGDGAQAAAPRPRLTRLGGPAHAAPSGPQAPRLKPELVAGLSPRQSELLRVVADTPTVRAAAERLQVSRSNVYASLRRIARRLGVGTVSELVVLARRGIG
jgi:CheY-like chemotaxis protein/DNA-binding CsgD family transcriptional regulator